MSAQGVKRKLSAIFSADVEGYSRLMAEDEVATVQTLTAYREVMRGLIEQHRGRVVDSPGDNLLAEFSSVVDAVQCAVAVQKEFQARNAELPEDRRMEFRIGINLGDVIEEGDRIYGDGVNIAARLEALADPGGICVSKTAFDQIETKLPLGYEYLGDQTVKNIPKPVGAYRVLMEPRVTVAGAREEKKPWSVRRKAIVAGAAAVIVVTIAVAIWHFYVRPAPPPVEPASPEKMAYPLPDKPSIAVLPFANISGDPKEDYFSDGITEEIITGLSKVPRLFVIARNSTFTYKGKPVKVQHVAQDLGVRYVLEGSVRKAGDRVRITAQLVDAITGKHLWAEKYDGILKDIFALQDEITLKVIAALQVKLTEGEQALIVAGGTDNFEAYAKFLQGVEHIKRFNRDGNLLARKMAEEAIALDPNYPRGYRLLAATHRLDVTLGISESPKQSLAKAAELYQKVIAMDPSDAPARGFLGMTYTIMRQHEKGIAEVEKAVALNPNAADAQAFFGYILTYNGRPKEAIEPIKKAIRLNPFPPHWYFATLGLAYCHAGMYEEAILALEKALRVQPRNLVARLWLAVSYSLLGREEEARAEAAEVLRRNPKFSLQRWAKGQPYKEQADKDLVMNALRKAGLPETPPLPLPDKPSIAVLPFTNMSEDPKQEYFSDGITEEIITALSKVPKLFVIARHSTFTYKGKPVKVQHVGRELGVRYVLEGSVRMAGDRVRITAQLIDASTGHHLWAERYDRELKDIFAVQDEITKKIITAMEVKLTEGEQARAAAKGTNNLEAYLKYLQAMQKIYHFNRESNALGKQLAEEAIALDPEYASAYFALGRTHIMDVWLGSSKSPKQSMAKAMELLQKAIEMDATYAEAYGVLGFTFSIIGEFDKGVATAEQAVALNPNTAHAHAMLGHTLRFAGRSEEAIPAYKKAIRLNPIPPTNHFFGLGLAYCWTGQYEEAIKWCEKAVRKDPGSFLTRLMMTVVYSMSGREEDARTEAAEVLRINPKFSVEKFEKGHQGKDKEKFIGALRKAGLK